MRASTIRATVASFAFSASLAAAGCADLRGLATLSADLRSQYGVPANVNLNNGRHLRITFQNVPPEKVAGDSSARARFARDVAAFARHHYPDASRLDDISVAFATVSTKGPVTISKVDGSYDFPIDALP